MLKNTTIIDEKLTKLWHNRDKDWEEELKFSRQLWQESLSLNYPQGKIGALVIQANCFVSLNQAQEAFDALERAIDLLDSINITPWSIRLHFVYGTLYRNFGDFSQALEHYLAALDHAKVLGDSDELDRANGNLALIYLRLQEYEKAIEIFQQILSTRHTRPGSNRLFSSYLNLATAYYYTKKPSQSIAMASKALEFATTKQSTLQAHGNLGAAYLIDGNFDKAKYYLEKSYKLSTELGNPITQCVCGVDLADYFIEIGESETPTDLLLQALTLARDADFKQGIKDCHQRLCVIYRKQKNWEQALLHHEALYQVDKEMFNENSDKRIRNLEVLHKLEVLKESEDRLSKKVAEQTIELQRLLNELELAYETTLEGWAQALELRDKETEGHSRRVTKLSMSIGEKVGLDEEEIRYLCYGALLHDIGKMGVPDEVLNKPGALTSEERKIIEHHPTYAYEMLKDIGYLQSAISIPYSHHENWDGTGYPQGLLGDEIPLSARIFSIADNWDALTSDRPYRKAWSREKTLKYIQEESGKKFDPNIVETFLAMNET